MGAGARGRAGSARARSRCRGFRPGAPARQARTRPDATGATARAAGARSRVARSRVTRARSHRPRPPPAAPSSRVGGAVVLGVLAAIAIVVVLLIVGIGGGGGGGSHTGTQPERRDRPHDERGLQERLVAARRPAPPRTPGTGTSATTGTATSGSQATATARRSTLKPARPRDEQGGRGRVRAHPERPARLLRVRQRTAGAAQRHLLRGLAGRRVDRGRLPARQPARRGLQRARRRRRTAAQRRRAVYTRISSPPRPATTPRTRGRSRSAATFTLG